MINLTQINKEFDESFGLSSIEHPLTYPLMRSVSEFYESKIRSLLESLRMNEKSLSNFERSYMNGLDIGSVDGYSTAVRELNKVIEGLLK